MVKILRQRTYYRVQQLSKLATIYLWRLPMSLPLSTGQGQRVPRDTAVACAAWNHIGRGLVAGTVDEHPGGVEAFQIVHGRSEGLGQPQQDVRH